MLLQENKGGSSSKNTGMPQGQGQRHFQRPVFYPLSLPQSRTSDHTETSSRTVILVAVLASPLHDYCELADSFMPEMDIHKLPEL